jgi:hypothetical protein
VTSRVSQTPDQDRSGVPSLDATVAVRPREAATRLSIGLDSFERHVLPGLRTIRCGRLRLVPVKELERWVEENAVLVGEDW